MEKTGKHKFLPGTKHKTAADTEPGSAWEAKPFVFCQQQRSYSRVLQPSMCTAQEQRVR